MQHILTGISDEADGSLMRQMKAHRLLNWTDIELRTVSGKDIAEMSHEEFATVELNIQRHGFKVSAISSRIGNWEREVDRNFEKEILEFKTLVHRAKRLRAPYIRVMSYNQGAVSEDKWKEQAVSRLQYLCEIASTAQLTLLHENCAGWGSQSPQHSVELVKAIGKNNFALLFDTGNPAVKGQNSLEWLDVILPYIKYVHVKDVNAAQQYTFPGSGCANVLECLRRLLSYGYTGPFSIEPHMFTVPHLQKYGSSSKQFRSYVQYGNRLQQLLEIVNGEANEIYN